MRSLALFFLCLCIAISGTATAVPMTGMATDSTAPTMVMDQDCPDMVEASSVHEAAVADHGKNPACCQDGSCKCAIAHVTLVRELPALPSQPVPVATVAATGDTSAYSSPALARLVRPPIS